MNRMRLTVVAMAASCMFFSLADTWALTPDEVISLKNAGVSDQTIQLMIRQEQEAAAGNPNDSPARKEIKDKDGKPVVVYSTGRPTGNNQLSNDNQTEKAWEMLRTIIIDNRKPRQP